MATSLIDFNALRPNAAMEAYQQGQQNQLAQMQLGQAQQAIRDAEAEREAWKGASNYAQVQQRLMGQGLGKQALAVGAAEAKQRADKIALLKDTTALMKATATRIMANPENAAQELAAFGQQTGTDVSRELAQVQAMGGNLDAIKQFAAGHALEADKLLPKFQHFGAGGVTQLGTSDWQGRFTPTGTVKHTATPGELMADARARERNAQEAKTGVYQQDDQGRLVWLPSKLNAGEVPKARLVMAPGVGMQPMEGKPSEKVAAERTSINQQRSIMKTAISEVEKNPDAFGLARGVSGEMLGGRMETPEQTQSRAVLFNTVSSIIHERAGTAQSAGEKETLMRFLPSEYDAADTIVNKLKGYEKWLDAKEAGTGKSKSESPKPSSTGNTVSLPDGRTMTFPDAAAAAAFKKAAGL
jgi:hypothetical protein